MKCSELFILNCWSLQNLQATEASGKATEALEKLAKEKAALMKDKSEAQTLLEELQTSKQEMQTRVRKLCGEKNIILFMFFVVKILLSFIQLEMIIKENSKYKEDLNLSKEQLCTETEKTKSLSQKM